MFERRKKERKLDFQKSPFLTSVPLFIFIFKVLAHRGRYWTLLQNSARALWNCCHTALLRVYTPTLDDDNSLLTIDELRSLAWKPLHMAADCMLDMMSQLQVDLQAQADRVKSTCKMLNDHFYISKCQAFHEQTARLWHLLLWNRSLQQFTTQRGGGHIVSGADPVGVGVSVTLFCMHDILWTGGWTLTKFACL